MSFITAFILLVFGGLSASVLTGKKFGIMMPVTAMLSIFVLYFCGLFTALYAGAIVTFCLLGALILALVVLVSLPTTRARFLPRLVEEIKNPVLYIFIVVAVQQRRIYALDARFEEYVPIRQFRERGGYEHDVQPLRTRFGDLYVPFHLFGK